MTARSDGGDETSARDGGKPLVRDSHSFVTLLGYVLRELARSLVRAVRAIGRAAGAPVSDEQRVFMEENQRFWDDRGSSQAEPEYIVVEPQDHPLLVLSNASFAAIVGEARRLRPLFLLRTPTGPWKEVLRSYPHAAFVHLDHWRHLPLRWLAVFRAVGMFRGLGSGAELLGVEKDGIRFGDVLYDAVLANGWATVDRIDGKVFQVLCDFHYLRTVAKRLARRHRIRAYLGHFVGLPTSTFARYFVQAGCELLDRTGSSQFQLKKLRSPADVGTYPLRPEDHFFSYLTGEGATEMEARAEARLHARMHEGHGELAARSAFHGGKRRFEDPSDFCSAYDLDPGKKVVFVMLHEFTDFPHSQFSGGMLFQDYYHWFIKTLEVAKDATGVNWIFKEHPAQHLYPMQDVSLPDIFEALDEPHIRFLRYDSHFHAASIQRIAHALVTCLGTAGLENACCGMPCVLAAESPYSGYGFTIEPTTVPEYVETLRNVEAVGRLTRTQVRAAKAVLYFIFDVLQGSKYRFAPSYPVDEIRGLDPNRVWLDAAAVLRDHASALRDREVSMITDFLLDATRTQFVDPDLYPLLAGVASRRSRQPSGVAGA